MDKSKPRIFVYHADYEPKILYVGQEEEYYKMGWFDSPAKCKGFLKKVNVDPENAMEVQVIAEATKEVAEDANKELNLELMSVRELKAYARKHDVEYHKNATKKKMLDLLG